LGDLFGLEKNRNQKLISQKERKTMKTKKHFFLLTAFIAIMCSSVHANSGLTGIRELNVTIYLRIRPRSGRLMQNELHALVNNKLEQAGIKITPRFGGKGLPPAPQTGRDVPSFWVYTDILRLHEPEQYIFHVRTCLTTKVFLAEGAKVYSEGDYWILKAPLDNIRRIEVDVWKWKENAVMQAVPVQDMPTKVTEAVVEQVDAFIADYFAANPPGKQPADANNFAALITAPTRETKKPVKLTTAEQGFVASKNSKVFHKPNCSSAKRIKPGNLVTYGTRAKAAEAGKRPCKICKP
jgi:cytochrome c1